MTPSRETKSVSAETTFNQDLSDIKELADVLLRLCERASSRMKAKSLAGRVVTLKLKTADFRTITRRRTLSAASNLARIAYDAALPMLEEFQGKMRTLNIVGHGYSEDEINAAPAALEGKTELDALITYLQVLGTSAPKAN